MADFETWESLGRNAYGTVYKGVQFSLKREVAIFELDPSLRKEADRSPRFWDEITFLAGLTDDRLVPVFAVDRGQGWIVMELMCGNCAQLLGNPQDPEVARSILRQALSGLQRLHEENRTHGDVRPHSLLINRGGRIKLAFSIGSAVVGGLPYQKRMMKYVAPEVVSPAYGEFGPQSDLYTLGFSVLELLLGPKFDAQFPGVGGEEDKSRTAWMRWHADENAKLPSVAQLVPGASLELTMVLDRLLKKKASERYASAAEALADLTQAPLVPIVAPEIGVTGQAGGGAALVSDVDRVFDPTSKYDVKGNAAGAAAGGAAAGGKSGGAAQKGSAAKQAGTKGTAAKNVADAKKKKNRQAILLGLLFLAAAVGILAFGPGEGSQFALKDVAAAQVKEGEELKLPLALAYGAVAQGNVTYKFAGKTPDGLKLDAASGVLTWTPTEEQGPQQAKVAIEATDESNPPQTAKLEVTIDVAEANVAPQLKPIAAQNAYPQEPLKLSAAATDADLPAQKLAYSLADKDAAGATIDAKTGEFAWTPPATQDDTAREFTIVVADDASPPLMASTTFKVSVSPRNRPPQIVAKSTKATIDEMKPWTLDVAVTDKESPREKLKLSLVDAPEGLALDAKTGKLAWTPTEAQGPGKYTFRVRAADDGTPPLAAEQMFELAVNEINLPPVVEKVAQQTIGLPLESGGAALTLDVKATDPDDAKATLTYKLIDPVPAGAALDAATGRFTFAPKLGDALTAPPATITLAVSDAGSPPLTTQASFKIEFKPADILAELRKKLDAAKTVGEISGVIEAAAGYRGNEAVDQKGLTALTADAFVKRGDAHIGALNFDAAAADFNTVVRDIDVNHIDARLGRAFCFGRKGDWRAAVTEYDDVIALDAENVAAYLNRAAAHYELKDMTGARDDADRAVQLMPENPAAFYVRGNAKVALKDRAGALADLKEAVKLFSSGKAPVAVSMYRTALEKCLELMDADPKLNDEKLAGDYRKRLDALKQRGAAQK